MKFWCQSCGTEQEDDGVCHICNTEMEEIE